MPTTLTGSVSSPRQPSFPSSMVQRADDERNRAALPRGDIDTSYHARQKAIERGFDYSASFPSSKPMSSMSRATSSFHLFNPQITIPAGRSSSSTTPVVSSPLRQCPTGPRPLLTSPAAALPSLDVREGAVGSPAGKPKKSFGNLGKKQVFDSVLLPKLNEAEWRQGERMGLDPTAFEKRKVPARNTTMPIDAAVFPSTSSKESSSSSGSSIPAPNHPPRCTSTRLSSTGVKRKASELETAEQAEPEVRKPSKKRSKSGAVRK